MKLVLNMGRHAQAKDCVYWMLLVSMLHARIRTPRSVLRKGKLDRPSAQMQVE